VSHNFKELKVWQKTRVLIKKIYEVSAKLPSREKYGLSSQIQRAAVSIASNIAEGSGRGSDKEFIYFLNIARASSFELETQVILLNDLDYINTSEVEEILNSIEEIQKMLFGFISKLKRD